MKTVTESTGDPLALFSWPIRWSVLTVYLLVAAGQATAAAAGAAAVASLTGVSRTVGLI